MNTVLRALALSLLLAAASPVLAAQPPQPEPQAVPAPPPPPKRAEDRGDFKVVYAPVKDPDYRDLQQIFRDTQLLEETSKALNATLALPADISVTLRECGEINARYEPGAKRISLCYELVGSFAEMFLAGVETEEEAEQAGIAVAGATLFVFFHQAGHALLDLYALPVTGNEEDAVDQVATYVLLQAGPDGEKAALDGTSAFLTREVEIPADKIAFWSEHSLSEQRFSNILCWIYGKSPASSQDLVEAGTLPVERAASCPAEYERLLSAWDPVLFPHLKVSRPGALPTAFP